MLRHESQGVTDGRNVSFITTSLAYGGAERQLTHLATKLRARGWIVRVISMLSPEAFQSDLEAADIPVVSLEMTRGVLDPRALLRTVRLLRRWRPQVLATYMLHANLLGRLAGFAARVPVVVSSVRCESFGGPVTNRLLAASDRMASVTVSNSAVTGRQLVQRKTVSPDRLRVIPNGIVARHYEHAPGTRDAVRRELGCDETDFLWLAVGRLERQKGYRNLLTAFQEVVSARPRSRLGMVGEGSQRRDLEEMAETLGIAHRTGFLGLRTDVPRLLSAADGFVLASTWEGLPNVIMEAFAAGVPVVATNVGGVPELVDDNRTGILVPPGDPPALARGMQRLSAMSEAERRELSTQARAHVSEHFDLERAVDQWEELFQELLSRRA